MAALTHSRRIALKTYLAIDYFFEIRSYFGLNDNKWIEMTRQLILSTTLYHFSDTNDL